MIPTPWTVGRRAWTVTGDVDAHGNPIEGWSDPAPVPVHAVGPRVAEEPSDPHRWVVVQGLTVYAPAGTVMAAHDRVVWPFAVDADGSVLEYGEEFEVDGGPADWTSGPWPHPTAGVSFDLTRKEG